MSPAYRPFARMTAATLVLAALVVGNAQAQQVFRLDDSASPRSRVDVRLDDSPMTQQRGPIVNVRFGRIDYRLATAPYIGRRARIHYIVPSTINGLLGPAGFVVEWQGGHLFADGSARPGERRQVWSGVVQEAWMGDTLSLSLALDARQLRLIPGADLGFESTFEIELLP